MVAGLHLSHLHPLVLEPDRLRPYGEPRTANRELRTAHRELFPQWARHSGPSHSTSATSHAHPIGRLADVRTTGPSWVRRLLPTPLKVETMFANLNETFDNLVGPFIVISFW
jgi:hypothetical protein